MATAPATPIRGRREMQEVKAPEQFQFTKQGQTLSGVLLDIEAKTVKEKIVPEYLIQNEQGLRFTCLATNDLQKKIMPSHVGHWINIRYERDDSSFQKADQSPMKVFKVEVSKEKEPGF
jgi:hypothetical protein